MTEQADAEIVWRCREAIALLEREKEDAENRLKQRTGERQAGMFWVSVASSTRETIDQEKVRALLGEQTPVKLSPTMTLRVKVAAPEMKGLV